MNKPTVQDIFQCFYPAYLEKYSPSPEQAKVARNIMNCKTGAYGTNISAVVKSVSHKVRFTVEESIGVTVHEVNVFIDEMSC